MVLKIGHHTSDLHLLSFRSGSAPGVCADGERIVCAGLAEWHAGFEGEGQIHIAHLAFCLLRIRLAETGVEEGWDSGDEANGAKLSQVELTQAESSRVGPNSRTEPSHSSAKYRVG